MIGSSCFHEGLPGHDKIYDRLCSWNTIKADFRMPQSFAGLLNMQISCMFLLYYWLKMIWNRENGDVFCCEQMMLLKYEKETEKGWKMTVLRICRERSPLFSCQLIISEESEAGQYGRKNGKRNILDDSGNMWLNKSGNSHSTIFPTGGAIWTLQ